MDGGQACRRIEDATKASFHADVRSLCESKGSFVEPPPSSRRSTTPTTPYAGYADTLPAPSSTAPSEPEWCVDTGALFHTMTTFELWEALERGHVLAWMRVWREGMECWTPVGEIADFACALAAIPPPPADPELEPEPDPELSADADTGPISAPTVTPEPPPPESAVRPVRRPLGSAGWIALGSAIALAALISAILVRLAAPPPAPVSGASSPVEATPIVEPPPPADDPPSPEASHHTERGQRRLPRAGRRAYGR
jgi:hypothetical protein